MQISNRLVRLALVPRSKFVLNVAALSTSHWAKVTLAPPDKILGLNEMFNKSTHPQKVNLGVGAYRDENGKPFILDSVKKAKELISKQNLNHEYAGIAGLLPFVELSIKFAYGQDASVIKQGQVAAVQTLSGTGACRLVGEYVAKVFGKGTKVYMPDPTCSYQILFGFSLYTLSFTCFYICKLYRGQSYTYFQECWLRTRILSLLQSCYKRSKL